MSTSRGTKIRVLRKKQYGREVVESWWERSVKEVGLERGVKSEGVMDGESGELTEREDVVEGG